MRNLCLIIIVGASLTGIVPAAEKAVDFSGAWVLDPAHSEISQTTPALRKFRISTGIGSSSGSDANDGEDSIVEPMAGQVENLTLKIVQTPGEAQIMRQFTADGREQSVPQKFALDGSQCINLASDGRGDFVSRSSLEKGKLINSGTETITMEGPRIEIYVKEEYSISKDGEKLTIKTMRTTSRGIIKLKQVFRRGDTFKF